MASQKTTIDLPSKLFSLYVSVGSNKARFQGGRGIEGIGVIPHELVEFDPADLQQQRDTLIARADASFPRVCAWAESTTWTSVSTRRAFTRAMGAKIVSYAFRMGQPFALALAMLAAGCAAGARVPPDRAGDCSYQ